MKASIERIVEVEEIPSPTQLQSGMTLSIASRRLADYTHGFFKYPCKFIPHIPRWALRYYLPMRGGVVLDPFCGSGTTLVEGVLGGKTVLGVDVDPLSRLITRVKSTPLSPGQIDRLKEYLPRMIRGLARKKPRPECVPPIPNMRLWFTPTITAELACIRAEIEACSHRVGDKRLRDFLQLCFAAIIRRSSNADDQSPKPYVSRKIPKRPADPTDLFHRTVQEYIRRMEMFSKAEGKGKCFIVGEEARRLDRREISRIAPEGVDLAITSPPYINAFDYVRSLKLENLWLGLVNPEELEAYRGRHIGTEQIRGAALNSLPRFDGYRKLNRILAEVDQSDRKRAHVVSRFFGDMNENLGQVWNVLKPGGTYCLVVGESVIRGVRIPTHKILADLGERVGFRMTGLFSYAIKNPYLRFPRKGRGGLIKKDWVVVLRKPA